MDRDLWHCLGVSDQDHPQEKEKQKGKMVVWGGLINSWEKKIYIYLNSDFQRIAIGNKKAFLTDRWKEIEESNRMGKTRDLFKKLEIPREIFMQR